MLVMVLQKDHSTPADPYELVYCLTALLTQDILGRPFRLVKMGQKAQRVI